MNTKLTLNVNKAVIEQAKSYAKSQNISLSRLIESYLASLISKERDPIEITPLVKSLSGIIQSDSTLNSDKEYSEFLNRKYK